MKGNNSGEAAPWNSSQQFLMRIEEFWTQTGQAKVSGQIIPYFRSLEIIFMSTENFYTPEEVKACEDYIRKIEGLIESKVEKRFSGANIWVGENLCDKLYRLLAKLLFKYDLTYYKKNTGTWEEQTESDFS